MSCYHKGQRVTIYQDPETREKPEGKAILHALIIPAERDDPDALEYWDVVFADDPTRVVSRWIK